MNETQKNLLRAFAGESMARNKYTFFAKKAREEGHEWIAHIFEETADNEKAHAEREFQFIKSKVEMSNSYSINPLNTTLENLKEAAAGEKFEWGTMYPDFEKTAKEENEDAIATVFKEIGEVEEKHEERYLKLAELLESGKLYACDSEAEWKCENCGYIHKGNSAPKICPACGKPQGYYKQLNTIK